MHIVMRKAYEEWKANHPEGEGCWKTWCGAWVAQQTIINQLLGDSVRLKMEINRLEGGKTPRAYQD